LASTADQVEFFLQSLVLSNACCHTESIEAILAFALNLAPAIVLLSILIGRLRFNQRLAKSKHQNRSRIIITPE
jgi:hypothetical protein